MKTAVNESQNSMVNITTKSNDLKTTTEPSMEEQYPSFLFFVVCLTMSNINIIIIIIMMFTIIHQITTTLQANDVQKRQLQSTIPCGTKYLKETIGISITNNHLYQFLFINDTIQIIRYDYRKSTENNDYKLNLIDGQMLANGLEDLIPSDIVEQLMTIIQWTEFDDNDDDEEINQNKNKLQPIISMAMSINNRGKIRIYCLKSLDQYIYNIGDYNQEIDMTTMEIFHAIQSEKLSIMGTISNHNGIIISLYSKLSFYMNLFKLQENSLNFESSISFAINSSIVYQINEYPTEQEQQTLTKSFGEIFGQNTFTYGFVSDNNQMFLFANHDEKLISFSMNIFNNQEKYPFKLQSYQDFFHCNKTLDPVKIDDNKQITISTTITNTVKQSSTTAVNGSQNTITTEPSLDEQYPSFLVIIIITIISIVN
ncbi:hypothetical protein DERP_004275 [Dermatophagoides pteronyssinus]|uniref:Transmembrane protein n=1 Tax=Dermatophagoides pteronyssinus TaxID=6956 RepID=A0ABQ8J9B4_DERPT|nr:hypothetical protein DERP_004275 [Dermatophagoides pteronyssinus]